MKLLRTLNLLMVLCWVGLANAAERPNLLLVTLDDMSADSVGVFGARVAATTPNIDRLARQGMRFDMAHVQVANCFPSRNVMWSGLYPHSSGIEGFYPLPEVSYPTLGELLHEAGYYTAIWHKLRDSVPYRAYPWDMVLDTQPALRGLSKKAPASYARATAHAVSAAAAANRPFALLVNVADPHVPLYRRDRMGNPSDDANPPSRIYGADDIAVPGFLPDDAEVRAELADYYSSVRRADDAVGAILHALEQAGAADNTLVLLLSDHGMPFPFAKTQLYHQSTRTPLVVRWPGVVAAGGVDNRHMVSSVDILPTLLEAVGEPLPGGLQGRSFLPLLRGGVQDGRELVFKDYNENAAGQRRPMRAVQTPRHLYIFNPWSDGERTMNSATEHTATYRRMQALAVKDAEVAARVALFRHRVPEELYDVVADPDCLHNLVGEPARADDLARLRGELEAWMQRTADPMLDTFRRRDTPGVLHAYMVEQLRREQARREARKPRQVPAAMHGAP